MVMKHFMINDTGNDIFGDTAPVQHRINPDNVGSIGIACQFYGILSSNKPSGSPGNMAVYFVGKILLIDLLEKFLKIEVASIMTKNSSPRFGRCFSDFVVIRCNKISKRRRCFLFPATNKSGK